MQGLEDSNPLSTVLDRIWKMEHLQIRCPQELSTHIREGDTEDDIKPSISWMWGCHRMISRQTAFRLQLYITYVYANIHPIYQEN